MNDIIKNILKQMTGRVGLYNYLSNWHVKYLKKVRRQNYNKHNKELLFLVDDILTSKGYTYWLSFGTLLGAYRDKAFIPHDNDLDIGMFWENCKGVKEALQDGGLNLFAIFYYGDYKKPDSMSYRFEYKNVYIDIDFFLHDDNNSSIIKNSGALFIKGEDYTIKEKYIPIQIEDYSHPFSGLIKMQFMGRMFNVPANTEDYIIANYGNNYRTPDSTSDYHDYAKNIKVYPLEEKHGYMYLK